MAILNDDEFVETEGRAYVNPQTALDESNAFIENLRDTQQSNNQQIQTDTYNLGTEVPSNLGGLTSPVGEGGAGDAGLSYFTSRYQTPQTNAVVENLRSVAQAQALSQALQNEQEKWQKRYNDAYRNYQKRAYDNATGGGGNNGGNNGNGGTNGDVTVNVHPDNPDEDGTATSVGSTSYDHSSWGDFVAGKGERTISYEYNGRTYYANIYNQTGVNQERYIGMDTSAGLSYNGQQALNFLNKVVSSGGKIYGPNGEQLTPQQALTGSPVRW